MFCRFPSASRKHLAHTQKDFHSSLLCGSVLIALLQGDVTKVWRSTSRDEAEPTKYSQENTVGQQLENGIEVITMRTQISSGFIAITRK